MARFYITIVQSVLLYGYESWVIDKSSWNRLKSFHMRCARHIAGRHIRFLSDDTWEYPSSTGVLEDCGLFDIKTYILRRRSTLHRYLLTRPILQECMNTPPLSTNPCHTAWWDQEQLPESA